MELQADKDAVCRLCMYNIKCSWQIPLINIFEYHEDLSVKIEKCTSIQVSKSDSLPECICMNCTETVLQYYEFRDMCLKSDNLLKAKANTLKHDDVNSNKKVILESNYDDSSNSNLIYGSNCFDTKEDDNNIEYNCKDEQNSDIHTNYMLETDFSTSHHPTKTKVYAAKSTLYKIDDSMRDIIGNNLYTCDICLKVLDSFIEYYDHQETHNGSPVFQCSKCIEVFSERKHLLEHDARHKIPCHICSLEVLPKSMPAHLLIHTDIHKCFHCGLRHISNAALEKHIKARHAGIKGFMCHICGKQSSCQSSMNRHMAYHSNERPYKCKFCEFSAKSLNIVQVHTSRKHFAEQRVCEICAKIFKSQPSLVQHMKRIHTTRKHVCEICSKAFIEKYNLTRHLRKHVGQRLHECKVCQKDFFTVRQLKEHMHSHRQGCVNCPKCGKEFFYKKYFNKHVLRCTNSATSYFVPQENESKLKVS